MKHQAFTLLCATLYTFLLAPLAPLWAESALLVADGGNTPPQIRHQPSEQATVAGAPLQIEAEIISVSPIEEAVLLYRRIGASGYTHIRMRHRGKGRYTARIPDKDVLPPGLEYFIQATDTSGNMTTYGQPLPQGVFKLIPLVATVESMPPQDDQTFTEQIFPPEERTFGEERAPAGNPWYKKWWVWTAAVVVVAGVVAASGGGSGGSDAPGSGAPNTGTLTISGPVPGSP